MTNFTQPRKYAPSRPGFQRILVAVKDASASREAIAFGARLGRVPGSKIWAVRPMRKQSLLF
jgi:hypothetical protein